MAGSELWTRPDSTGSFVLAGIPSGPRRIEVSAPQLELAGLDPPSAELVVRKGESYFVDLTIPSPQAVVRRACGPEAEGSVVLVGRVMDATGNPVSEARVTTAWTRRSIMVPAEGEASVDRTPSTREVRSDTSGAYRICGLPRSTDVSLRVEAPGGERGAIRGEVTIELPAGGIARQDLVLEED